jgi:ribosomal protein S3
MKLFRKKAKFQPWTRERSVKRSINWFFQNEGINRSSLEITNITVKETKKDRLIINITLQRPGLLIGKEGKTINALEKYLEMLYETRITILIHESKLWV